MKGAALIKYMGTREHDKARLHMQFAQEHNRVSLLQYPCTREGNWCAKMCTDTWVSVG